MKTRARLDEGRLAVRGWRDGYAGICDQQLHAVSQAYRLGYTEGWADRLTEEVVNTPPVDPWA